MDKITWLKLFQVSVIWIHKSIFPPGYKSTNPLKINYLHMSFKRSSMARQSWKKRIIP